MENKLPEWMTLPANTGKVMKAREDFAKIESRSLSERASKRSEVLRETASDGMTIISAAETSFIDLAIHRDTFLDDAATTRDVLMKDSLFWRSRYEPIVGVYMGSLHGGPPAMLYQTQDYYGTLEPFVVDTEEVQVPNLSYTTDPAELGIRDAGLRRQAEALKIKQEGFLLNTILGAPLGANISNTIVNYVNQTGNPYDNRTVYIADPGVQPGTYETTNIVSVPQSGGLGPQLAEALIANLRLAKRVPRTVHIPEAGQPWRALFRYANVNLVANAPLTGAANSGLYSIPPSQYEEMWNKNFSDGFILPWFGMPLKFKSNNAMPKGYGIVTTDQPAAEIINVTDRHLSVDYVSDPKNPYFSRHYEKYTWAIAVPDPWIRNIQVIFFGTTTNL